MQAGTYEAKNTVIEKTPQGDFTYTYTKQIAITEQNFYGKTRFYQRERTYRNSVIIFSANYPADTDYAKARRSGICPF